MILRMAVRAVEHVFGGVSRSSDDEQATIEPVRFLSNNGACRGNGAPRASQVRA